jgi:hypothetical protein
MPSSRGVVAGQLRCRTLLAAQVHCGRGWLSMLWLSDGQVVDAGAEGRKKK